MHQNCFRLYKLFIFYSILLLFSIKYFQFHLKLQWSILPVVFLRAPLPRFSKNTWGLARQTKYSMACLQVLPVNLGLTGKYKP